MSKTVLLALIAAASLSLVGCGGGGNGNNDSPTPTVTGVRSVVSTSDGEGTTSITDALPVLSTILGNGVITKDEYGNEMFTTPAQVIVSGTNLSSSKQNPYVYLVGLEPGKSDMACSVNPTGTEATCSLFTTSRTMLIERANGATKQYGLTIHVNGKVSNAYPVTVTP